MNIDLSRVSNSSLAGRLLRLPLHLLPRQLVMPVLQGPLAGTRWIVGASTHGCWLGTYEFAKQRAFAAAAAHASVILDIGANVGFYTLLSAGVAGPSARVFAFEPLPRNLEFLNEHIRLNHLANVTVLPVAVAAVSARVRFDDRQGPSMGAVAQAGNLEVSAVRLDDLSVSDALPDPDLVKIDVEGGEEAVFAGGETMFRRARPTIFLSTHGADIHERCLTWLRSLGYATHELAHDELIATPARTA